MTSGERARAVEVLKEMMYELDRRIQYAGQDVPASVMFLRRNRLNALKMAIQTMVRQEIDPKGMCECGQIRLGELSCIRLDGRVHLPPKIGVCM